MFGMPGNTREEQIDVMVSHIDDIDSSYASESTLGRKGLSLFNLHNFDVPIPEFFVISPLIFKSFVKKVLDEKSSEILKEKNPEPKDILNIFHRFDFDEDIKKEIIREYTKLSGFSDAWVSVRASTCAPEYNEVSFSGVFQTDLNVRGINSLLLSIKSVYASLFTDSAVMYAVREGVELADISLGVVVQKMVHAEVSGTCFTLDPVTLSHENLSVEAVFGLGDVIANGEVTPDTYQLKKKNLEIIEKHISPQDWMKIRSLNTQKGGFEKINISSAWSHKQKLEDKYIEEVAKISLVVEDKVGDSVDVEWVMSGGRIFVLQYKPAYTKNSYLSHHVQFGGYSYVSNNIGSVISDIVSKNSKYEQVIEKSVSQLEPVVEKKKEEEVKAVEEKPLVQAFSSGIGVSFGNVKGKVKKISRGDEKVLKENILVLETYTPTLSKLILNSSGVIAKRGGLTSELSLLCREKGIPAIVGVENALELFNDGDEIEIDGNSGSIYMIDKAKIEEIEVAKDILSRKKDSNFITSKEESKMEIADSFSGTKTATKIFLDGNSDEVLENSDGVVFVDLDSVMIKFGKHPTEVLLKGEYKKYASEIIDPIVKLAARLSPKEVVLVIGKSTVSEFKKILKDPSFENESLASSTRGATRYLANKGNLEVAVRLVRRLRNIHGLRNITLGVYQPQGGNVMREIKKEISARGLRRGSSFSIYAVIENPAEVIMADDILDAEIDGIILDTSTLARHVFSLPLASKDVVYDLGSNTIFRIIDSISQSTKAKSKKFIPFVEDNKDLVKYVVSKGVWGIVVPNEYLNSARKLVADQEAKIVLGIGK